MKNEEKSPADIDAHVLRALDGPCFICEFLAGNPRFAHHLVFQDDQHVAFLDRYTTLTGHVLVAPLRHLGKVTGDFSPKEYLDLQMFVYRVSEAIARAVPTERMYIYSFGSNQGNSHVHWHLAPLPPGVPYDRQQFHAVMMEHGVLNASPEEMSAVARMIAMEIR